MIGIISYNINSKHLNYGAALHSYAFQKYLEKFGCDSVIINYLPLKIENYHIKYPILNPPYANTLNAWGYHFVNWGIGGVSNLRKYYKFRSFFKNNTRITHKKYKYKNLTKLTNIENYVFNIFVCESDVIWKAYHDIKFDDVFYLNIPIAEGKKKIAYAPSLGSKPFSAEETLEFKKLTSSFCAISIRESQGAKYVSSLLGKKIDWVLDPTLLLEAEDYEKILIEPKEKNYILVYNCMLNDRTMVREAEKYANKKGKQLIEISNWLANIFYFNHKIKTSLGIEEFLGYFKYADEIICNAFHGFCFSIIFKKDVFLFQRDNSDYRMQNITDALGLSSRFIRVNDKRIPIQNNKIDFDLVYKKLYVHRKRSELFIQNNILSIT